MKKVTATFNPETHKIMPIELYDLLVRYWNNESVSKDEVYKAQQLFNNPEYPTEPAVTHCDASGYDLDKPPSYEDKLKLYSKTHPEIYSQSMHYVAEVRGSYDAPAFDLCHLAEIEERIEQLPPVNEATGHDTE